MDERMGCATLGRLAERGGSKRRAG